MPKYLTVPVADGDNLSNAAIHTSETLTGLTNGTGYLCYLLSEPSDTFTPVSAAWRHPKAAIHLDYVNDRAFVDGTEYAGIAAARSAGAIVQTGGIDRVAVTPAASWALVGTGTTAATAPANNSPRYLAALDNGAFGSGIDQIALLSDVVFDDGPYSLNVAMFTGSASQLEGVPDATTSKAATTGTAVRMAMRAKQNATIVSMDGVTLGTDPACALPAITQLVIGNRHDGSRGWAGAVGEVLFINEEITESELNAALA